MNEKFKEAGKQYNAGMKAGKYDAYYNPSYAYGSRDLNNYSIQFAKGYRDYGDRYLKVLPF